MADKKYSQSDLQKMTTDRLADLRAKGIDAVEVAPLHPGGMQETLKIMEQNRSFVRDQSQAQTNINRAHMRETTKRNTKR